jgi:hypothetical protein
MQNRQGANNYKTQNMAIILEIYFTEVSCSLQIDHSFIQYLGSLDLCIGYLANSMHL